MFSYKIFKILSLLLVVQAVYGKQFNPEEHRNDTSPKIQLLVYTADNLDALIQQYVNNAVNFCRDVLKDESFMANQTPEVQKFKRNLTMYVAKYESNKDLIKKPGPMRDFDDIIEVYLDVPEENRTPESSFILNILNKYQVASVKETFKKQFNNFMEKFMQKFEESREHYDEDLLLWYDHLKDVTDFWNRYFYLIAIFYMY